MRYHGLWLDTSRRPHRTGDLIDASGLEVVRAAVWVERKRAYEDYHSGSSNDPDEIVTILMVQGLETATYTQATWAGTCRVTNMTPPAPRSSRI